VIEGMTLRGDYAVRVDPSTLQPLIDGSLKYGLIEKPFSANDMIAN